MFISFNYTTKPISSKEVRQNYSDLLLKYFKENSINKDSINFSFNNENNTLHFLFTYIGSDDIRFTLYFLIDNINVSMLHCIFDSNETYTLFVDDEFFIKTLEKFKKYLKQGLFEGRLYLNEKADRERRTREEAEKLMSQTKVVTVPANSLGVIANSSAVPLTIQNCGNVYNDSITIDKSFMEKLVNQRIDTTCNDIVSTHN